MFPTRRDFVAYLHRYVEVLELPIETNSAVTALDRRGDAWLVRTANGDVTARDVVVATGTSTYRDTPDGPVTQVFANCFVMRFDDEGRCREFTEYYAKQP